MKPFLLTVIDHKPPTPLPFLSLRPLGLIFLLLPFLLVRFEILALGADLLRQSEEIVGGSLHLYRAIGKFAQLLRSVIHAIDQFVAFLLLLLLSLLLLRRHLLSHVAATVWNIRRVHAMRDRYARQRS